jgi:rhamnogalacturonan endolyase
MKKTILIYLAVALIVAGTGTPVLNAADAPAGVFAARTGETAVYIGWRLNSQKPTIGYNVYRKESSEKTFAKLNKAPITTSTNYTDTTAAPGKAYQYQVCAAGEGNPDGPPRTVTVGGRPLGHNVCLRIGNIMPGTSRSKAKAGDIDGDNLPDFLIVTSSSPHSTLHVKIYHNNGDLACDIDMKEAELKSRTAWTLWDLDSDGKDELIGVMKENASSKQYKLHVIDPTAGSAPAYKVLATIDVPSVKPTTTRYKTISIAYLDGKTPYILYGSGHQQQQTMDVCAYTFDKPSGTLKKHWDYNTRIATKGGISSSHQFEVADVDKDGKDEVFYGSYTFNEKGFNGHWGGHKWSHSDIVRVDYIRPGQQYQDVCFWLEQSDLGIHLTDYKGKELWKKRNKQDKLSHAHAGWSGDVISQISGQEIWVFYKDPAHKDSGSVLYDCRGEILFKGAGRTENLGYGTVDWDGKLPLEVIHNSAIQRFQTNRNEQWQLVPISPPQALGSGDAMVMDIIGDYREEIISFDKAKGSLRMTIFTNLKENSSRRPSPSENRQYLQRHRWSGH